MMKKYNNEYWKNEIQGWFCKYVLSKDSIERNKIYNDYLHEPLSEIVRSECERFGKKIKFHTSDKRKNLETDALTKLVKEMNNYYFEKGTKIIKKKGHGQGYSYCRIIVRSYLADVSKRECNKNKMFKPLDDYDDIKIY